MSGRVGNEEKTVIEDKDPVQGILADRSRFALIEGEEYRWLFDEKDFGLHALADAEAADTLERLLGDPDGDGGPPAGASAPSFLEGLVEVLEAAEALEPPVYATADRVSNLKLALGSRCPSDCDYCFRRRKDPSPAPLGIGPRALEAMVAQHGRKAGLYVLSYNLTSEPLADLPALEELHQSRLAMEERLGKTINIYLCTSGTVQTPEALALTEKVLRGNRLAVSIDGPKSVHDRFRHDSQGRGSFDAVMALLRWAEGRDIRLEAQAVLTRAFPYPDLVLDSLLELGFASVTMKPVRPGFSEAFRLEDLPGLFISYDRFFDRVGKALLRDDRDFIQKVKHDFALKPLWKFVLRAKAEGRCFWGSSHLVVDAMGDYYPCDCLVGDPAYRCGSVGEGLDLGSFQQDLSWRTRKGCPDCWARSLCGGTCHVSGIIQDGDPRAIDPVECAMSKYFVRRCLEIAARLLESGGDPGSLGAELLRY